MIGFYGGGMWNKFGTFLVIFTTLFTGAKLQAQEIEIQLGPDEIGTGHPERGPGHERFWRTGKIFHQAFPFYPARHLL